MLFISAVMLYLTPLLLLIMYAGRWGHGWRYYVSTAAILAWISISFWIAFGELHD